MKNKVIKRIISGAFIGIDIGLFISILFSYLSGRSVYQPAPDRFLEIFANEINAMLVSVFIWAAIGTLFSITSLIFTHTEFSISKMTLLHCIINYVVFIPLSIFAGWYSFGLVSLASITVIYVLIYFIVWLVFMFINKKHIEEINAMLNKTEDF